MVDTPGAIPPTGSLAAVALAALFSVGPISCGDVPDADETGSDPGEAVTEMPADAGGQDAAAEPTDPPGRTEAPADTAALTAAVNARVEAEGNGPGVDVPRRYAFVDLDGDGVADGLALMQGMFCGTGGCSLYAFRGTGDGFDFVSSTSLVRGPFIVAETSTNGWRDLLMEVSGGGMARKVVRLAYDGEAYPGNPSGLPAQPGADYAGRVVFPVDVGEGGLEGFAELVGSYPRDVDLWDRPFLARRLEFLVRGRTDELTARMQTQSPVEEENGVYFVTGNMDNQGGSDGAIVVADPGKNVLKAWILSDGELETYEEVPVALDLPTDVRTMLNNWGVE